jgi:DNA repair exonuclease SbcCD ATPase subunit
MPKKISTRNTKAEILDAYKELEAAYQDLEKKATASPSKPEAAAVKTPETPPWFTSPKTETTKIPKRQPLPKDGNAHAPMEEVIQLLGQLGEKFNTALSQLSTNLLVEASSLKDVRTTVDAESSQLEGLYSLEIKEDTLSDLLKQYTETAEQYVETLKQKREESEKAWFEKNQAWQTEKEETEQRLQEQESADKKTHLREETEYRYNLTLKRGISDEEYNHQQQQQQQSSQELEESQRKAWEEREKALAEREKQFEEHKTKVERFPKDLEVAIKKAKDEGTGIARHQAKIKADLTAKEFAGEQEVYQLKIRSLEEQVADQTSQIDKLAKQLEAALKQAQELAVKAIEGASSHSSFQALKEIALEQAKNQPKAK